MELKNLKINFLGDSITEGFGASVYENCYVSMFQKNTGAVCRNYGIGGTRFAKQKVPSENPKYDLDFCSRFSEMENDADIVVIFGGTNDYGHGDAPIGISSDRTPDTFYGAAHYLFSGVKQKFPKSKIVILTPLHRSAEETTNINGFTLVEYVKIIREVANYYNLPIIDLYEAPQLKTEENKVNEAYFTDGLHPNDKGHALLAEIVADGIKNA